MYCADCHRYFTVRGLYNGTCTLCGRIVQGRRCVRCGHEWLPRSAGRAEALQRTCPGCHSPYWNRTRVRETSQAHTGRSRR